jgi:hypothetical protein
MVEAGLPTDTQIKAAKALFAQIAGLKRNEDILKELQGQMKDSCAFHQLLLQALAVNEFYSARCPDVYRAAKWISDNQVMQRYGGNGASRVVSVRDRIVLVKKIATLDGQLKGDGWPVFASKFAHFFIDPVAFPILDKNAEEMVLMYLGKRKLYPESDTEAKSYKTGRRYQKFYVNFCRLKKKLLDKYGKLVDEDGDELFSNKHLDEYLWLAANCRIIKLKGSGANPDVKKAFEKGNQSIKDLFGKLFTHSDPPEDNPILKKNIEKEENLRRARSRKGLRGREASE